MLINATTMRALYTGFSAAYQGGFAGVQPLYQRIATTVPSTTRENEYGWLGNLPRIREWIGERQVQNLFTYGYTLKNKPWEMTIGVDKDDLEDDNLGIYAPLFAEMGQQTAEFPDELIFPLLKAGFSTLCFDGQYFFDTDHPVIDQYGNVGVASNSGGGSGDAWFLMDVSRPLKPLIFQQRRAFDFVRMDAPTDEVVFSRKEYRYGVDGRSNAGFGFWQMAYGSKQPLNATTYEAARVAMGSLKGDRNGKPLGVRPGLLVVPPSLEGAGRELLTSATIAGIDNKWRGTAELLVAPMLA